MKAVAWARAYNHLLLQLRKRGVVYNYKRHCDNKRGHALLYYKTDAFTPGYIHDYAHTNNWEAAEIARILNAAGFWVDILDRSIDAHNLQIQDKYDLVIASASTDAYDNYSTILEATPSAAHVFYATTAAPALHNAQVKKRYTQFENRTKKHLPVRRLIANDHIPDAIHASDSIFTLGSPWANTSFDSYDKQLHQINISTAPFLTTNPQEIVDKDSLQFLFLAGSGNILKGLDIALEAFNQMPTATLHVCTPLEQDFLDAYRTLIESSPNIYVHGFLPLRGRAFRRISAACQFAILPSATEATATAGATCIRRGLVPIMTPAVGLAKAASYAHILPEHPTPDDLTHTIQDAITESPVELRRRSKTGYDVSQRYTQQSFSHTFSNALNSITG